MSSRNKGKSGDFLGKILIGVAGLAAGFFAAKVYLDSEAQTKKQKRVESKVTKQTDSDYDEMQKLMTCPISNEIMRDPVITECGHTFQKKLIIQWVNKRGNCPICKKVIGVENLISNFQLKHVIQEYSKTKH